MKKIISIFLAIWLICVQSLVAFNLSDVVDASSVSTDFGTWESPRTGTKYFDGGSYRFAFKGQGKIQPLFQGSPPSAKMGCNGFSLSGGFVALLGIDEIKKLLSDSGATLAWGIMMGLEYATPGLNKIFTDLRNWARQIQQLLSNMCAIGQKIAKSEGFKKMMPTIFDSAKGDMNNLFDKLNSGWDGVSDLVSSGLNWVDSNLTGDACSHVTGDAKKACEAKKGIGLEWVVEKISNSNSISITS